MSYYDKEFYEFHVDDMPERCFLCSLNSSKLFVVRHIESEKMVHLCQDCMVNNLSEYLLDNTRPWTSKKE
ncbi:MAG: hypothetical protein E4H39_01915 [Syntrophobacterales bacterium]|jgi:hypothetical protein|nr:MAG: hypothetical protein E4H39_01915 [Syntrophobacterales bacterium]